MSEPRLKSVQCSSPAGLHRMAYKEWGDPANPRVLVCVHGVTRVSDDFDALARAMSDRYRVVCPDVVGRGRSGRLADPRHYVVPQYVADMVTLVARVTSSAAAAGATEEVDWFGTSMGGLIGMILASYEGTPVRRLVLNDIGPTLDLAAMGRIGEYIGQDLRFAGYAEGSAYVRAVSASFGPHDDAQWDKLARDVLVQLPDGQWTRHYDLALAQPFKALSEGSFEEEQAALWRAWDAVRCPTLLVRGALSDLLEPRHADAMRQAASALRYVEVPGVGHAPMLTEPLAFEAIAAFLASVP